jgi:putative transposase
MRYAFIKGHHQQFGIRSMCNLLTVHPSGFYAWLKRPFSKRALEDKRQTELLKEAWEDNGKVYGYPSTERRKLHDDLSDQGETCCPNRVARLTRMAGIKAQIGYKRRIGTYG